MLARLVCPIGLLIVLAAGLAVVWGQTKPATQPVSTQVATLPSSTQAAASRPVYGTDSPAQWLSGKGKGERWIEATDRCRALLDQLDPGDARVKAYLTNLRRQCEVIRRVDAFNWKSITAVEFLQNALADLAAGKEPNRRYAGQELGFPYWSQRMQRIEAVWVHVPPAYDPGKSHQLFLYYKSGGGIHYEKGKAAGGYRPTAEMANKTDTFHAWSSLNIQVKGRMGVEIELEEFPAALAGEFSVDPGRVFLTGYSDGGFTALWLATHYPHLVAGIAPNCANWQYTNVEQVNLLNVPYLVVDGWGDGGYVEGNFLRFRGAVEHGLRRIGDLRPARPHVRALRGRGGVSGRSSTGRRRRAGTRGPGSVRYATWNLTWNRAYWVSIERAVEPCLASQIEAEVKEDNRIEVRTHNVAAYAVRLSDEAGRSCQARPRDDRREGVVPRAIPEGGAGRGVPAARRAGSSRTRACPMRSPPRWLPARMMEARCRTGRGWR